MGRIYFNCLFFPKVIGKTRPYNTINDTSPILPDSILYSHPLSLPPCNAERLKSRLHKQRPPARSIRIKGMVNPDLVLHKLTTYLAKNHGLVVIEDLYHVLKITHNHQPGHGMINIIYLSEISLEAVSLHNDWVRFFYYGQFNGHDIKSQWQVIARMLMSPARCAIASTSNLILYIMSCRLPIIKSRGTA